MDIGVDAFGGIVDCNWGLQGMGIGVDKGHRLVDLCTSIEHAQV